VGELSATAGVMGAGDATAFERVVEPLRPELRAHCYRMLGSVQDAEDAVQETMLRAWRGWHQFAGHGSWRSWLYTVATRACLDAVRTRARSVLPADLAPPSDHAVVGDTPLEGPAWLAPYPDFELGSGCLSPEARYEQREAVELAFVAALQHLTGNQRAALLLFEVVGLSSAEIAGMLGTSVAAVNSALERARKALAARAPETSQQQTLRQLGDARLREVVGRYCAALEEGDASVLTSLLTEDATWSMPPLPGWYRGRMAVMDFAVRVPLGSCGAWRHLPTSANGQPAVALYLRREGSPTYRAWSITVLSLIGDRIQDITSFLDPTAFDAFGLPANLD
jgi:RNA polymerase sigma-70 factor (ECF subfamily)